MTLEQLAMLAASKAADFINNVPGEEVVPTFFLLRHDGEFELVVAPWTNAREKYACCDLLREKLTDPRFSGYVTVSEAYVTDLKAGPERVEKLMITGRMRSGKNFMWLHLIEQLPDRRRVDLEKRDEAEAAGGHMNNLFEPTPPSETVH